MRAGGAPARGGAIRSVVSVVLVALDQVGLIGNRVTKNLLWGLRVASYKAGRRCG